MKSFVLMMAAAMLMTVLTPFALIAQIVRFIVTHRPLTELWWDIAIGLDQLGGAIMYGEPDWTVSSRTYWLREGGNKYAAWFEKLVNLFFGKNHCEESYNNEFGRGVINKPLAKTDKRP